MRASGEGTNVSGEHITQTLERSRELQEKFEFYLLALVFTLLGLAVQTAKFDGGLIATCFELAGWAALLVSGLAGILRLEWKPVVYGLLANKALQEHQADGIREALRNGKLIVSQETGHPLDPAAVLQLKVGAAGKLDVKAKSLEASLQRRYGVHKWAFFVGLAFLACSRGYVAGVTTYAALRALVSL